MSTSRINAAAAAAMATEDAIAKAAKALHADRFLNGFGVYVDRSAVIANLRTAGSAIEAALAVIQSCPWPTDIDYIQAEG